MMSICSFCSLLLRLLACLSETISAICSVPFRFPVSRCFVPLALLIALECCRVACSLSELLLLPTLLTHCTTLTS
ncbi:hypothetical protein DFP72DRAFT_164922 [Ephemerocybe angulata]|uniref:Secreted protein n=1 Tax=Ephemerocybe angulata TaxID=980116 RepID=A0A8H6MCE0_9AGAR|nr:hypothetical protein DFP72DRAFT_164922 [Tulosesus angulatus]